MDTQRLILFVVFSFSALMLWEAWQKEFRPPPPVAATAPVKGTSAADLPPSPSALPPALPAAPASSGAAAPPAGVATLPAGAGRTVTITTDLYRAEIDTIGGVITQVALQKHRDPEDGAKPYLALLRTPERTFVAQSGLLGEGMPNHRTVYTVAPGPRELAPGADRIDLRMQAVAPNGDPITQVLTFHRGSYLIDVAYDVTNKGAAPIAPFAYYQLTRDTKTQGGQSAYSMAPISYAGPVIYNDTDKFRKVEFADLDKLAADPSRKLPYTKNADNGWVGMVEHYFVSAHGSRRTTRRKPQREFYTQEARQWSLLRGCDRPGGELSRPAPPATVRVPLYVGPAGPGRSLAQDSRRVSTWSSTTASSRCIAAPLFWLLKWLHGIIRTTGAGRSW